MRQLLADDRGSAAPLFALTLGVIALLLSLITTSGLDYLRDRRMQALADLIALLSVRDQDYTAEFAHRIIADQGYDPARFEPELLPGRYAADLRLAPHERFAPGRHPYNGVRVRLYASDRALQTEAQEERPRLLAEAAAARREMVSFSVASRLLRVEDGITGHVLAPLMGRNGRLTVMDYEALAGISVDSGAFLSALAEENSIRAVTYDDLLQARIPAGTVIQALDQTLDEAGRAGLRDSISLGRLGPRRIVLGDMFAASRLADQPVLPETANVSLNVMDILQSATLLAAGDHQIDLDAQLGPDIASLSLEAGEPPQTASINFAAGRGARAETRQLALQVETGRGRLNMAVRIELATAEAELVRLRCSASGRVRAEFDVRTSPARLIIARGLLTGETRIDLGAARDVRIHLTENHIRSGEPETVRSGLGSQSRLAGIDLDLDPLLQPLISRLDEQLTATGIHLSEADIFLRDAQCSTPFLVE